MGKPRPQLEVPWIPYLAKEWLDLIVNHRMSVFEWGSGGSTIYFNHRVKHLVTIEHESTWHAIVKNQVDSDYRLIEPDTFDDPHYGTEYPKLRGKTFKTYAHAIDTFDDQSFDLISIDGFSRVRCAEQAAGKVKSGGWILLDNSERSRYASIYDLFRFWPRIEFYGPGPICTHDWKLTAWRRV